MKTSKPVATISFNTEPFLRGKLRELTKAGVIEFWAYIKHKPEPDEGGDEASGKAHFHVYMEPAKLVQTTEVRAEFREPDPANTKPRGCLQVVKSNFDNWYLYGLHNPDYLASKGERRVYSYQPDDFVSSDEDDMKAKVSKIDIGNITPYITMAKYQSEGKQFREYVLGERISIRDITSYQRAWDMLMDTAPRVERGGRRGHALDYISGDDLIDDETGEILEGGEADESEE